MAQPRQTNPISRTRITKSTGTHGEVKIHVRVTSHAYDLDLRGTGATVGAAIKKVRSKTAGRRP